MNTTPPGPSRIPASTPPSSTYRRSPSVSEAIQKFEAKTQPDTSSPSSDRKPPIPKRSGIPSRIPSSIRSPPSSPRKEGRSISSTGAASSSSRSTSMTGIRRAGVSRNLDLGLGVPGGSNVIESRRATDGKIRSARPTPSPASSTSSIPRPSTSTSTHSSSRRTSNTNQVSPRATNRPFPSSSASSLPRSTSDTFYTASSRSSTPPTSAAGPSRLTSPRGSNVSVTVSRPSPSPVKRPPPLRRKSSKPDLTQPKPRSPAASRRPSHQPSDSLSSQSSVPSTTASLYQSSVSSSQAGSKTYFTEFGDRATQPTPIALDSGSTPMVRGGPNRSSRSSRGTTADTPTSPKIGSPKSNHSIAVTIPKRTSSNPHSPNMGSPKTPKSANGPRLPISPRTSSRRLSSPTKDFPPTISPRIASRHVMLEPTVESARTSLDRRPSNRRGSSQSSVSRLSEAASTIREPVKRPTSAAASRTNSQGKASSVDHRLSPRNTPPISPQGSPSRLAARRLSASPRKSPNLTIQTPPPMLNSRLSSVSSINNALPTPPVPAKSPLRTLSRENSEPAISVPTSRKQSSRSGSGESNIAQVGTPTSLRTRLEKLSEAEISKPKGLMGPPEVPKSREQTPPDQQAAIPSDIRFTNFTVPSVYSQDSAPATANSWAWSEDTARSSVSSTARRRQSRLESVDWGKQKDLPPSSQRSSFDIGREGHRRSSSLPRLSMLTDKDLPFVPVETPSTAATYGSHENSTPTSPTTVDHREPAKSPSLPILREGKVVHHAFTPESPLSGAQSPAMLSSPTAARFPETPLRPLLPTSPSIVMSKRSHLIREIASSERAYAKDLALIRDAYMYRFLRPGSQYSTNGDSSISPSDASRRSSVYTYQTAETKRSTGSSTSSFNITPQPSIRQHKRSSSSIPSMAPPIGKPLSPADLKTVFLNLDQLATAAEELAAAFEQAMGEDVEGFAIAAREGEAGGDKLGEVFVAMIPRIRPLYTFYCARQSQASMRLVELQSDLAHNAHLKECWLSIKDRTHAWNLDSMLIKPVQRITKYPLLFDDLLNCTTPVHPDYFSIRTAAQMSKAIAVEIDEAKRRKDVVSNVINSKKAPSTNVSPKENKPPASKLLGLKRFRKDKAASSTVSLALSKSASSTELSLPAVIPDHSMSSFKDLAVKVEELDQCVRRVGKEIILWTAAAKEVLVAEDGVMRTWLRVVQLEPSDATDRRMLEFRKVIDSTISEVWRDLNDEVRQQIMPIFAKLLESTSNPRKVIHKRDVKYLDYTRYHALKASKKTIERSLASSAAEFVALHTQLVDELPAFLEGCLRILDIALVGFAKAQAKYHVGIKERLAAYEEAWMVLPLSPKVERSPTDTSTPRGIVKAWHESWAPYGEAMGHFNCTRPARIAASRIASFNTRPGSRPISRSGSPMLSPGLRHSASVTSPTSLNGSRPASPAPSKSGRFRSSSLRSQTTPSTITVTSPKESSANSSMFNLLRRSNSKHNVPKAGGSPTVARPPMHTRTSSAGGLKPSSASIISEASSRLSWGLPRISADPTQPIFEGLGLSPTKPTTGLSRNDSKRAISDPVYTTPPSSNNLFSVDLNSSQVSLASTSTNVDIPSTRRNGLGSGSGDGVGLGLGDVSDLALEDTSRYTHPFANVPSSPVIVHRQRQRTDEMDAAEGWRNEQVIYQCACVADFDPAELGDRRYRGLRFLSMVSGDLIDVFHEVGRIDELPSFPYPEVGVDNDGVLVARNENGHIGLVICSFLEPLRD
uniref:DH domain-containing protein n=1 Tax=Kwoniella dejecticola CBS 10117 TaxID=1296121 RepID=A0A1A5ZV31_9TREE|nr:uncharacterized protein I303_07574 [Kwoniella dejecticola CBS 10117]OBR81664.1 hypothetical protein I303_07574 [Kwoniella dejecticola CBS 10117]